MVSYKGSNRGLPAYLLKRSSFTFRYIAFCFCGCYLRVMTKAVYPGHASHTTAYDRCSGVNDERSVSRSCQPHHGIRSQQRCQRRVLRSASLETCAKTSPAPANGEGHLDCHDTITALSTPCPASKAPLDVPQINKLHPGLRGNSSKYIFFIIVARTCLASPWYSASRGYTLGAPGIYRPIRRHR